MKKITMALFGALMGSPAFADMPPTEFVSAHIVVTKGAQVFGQTPSGKRGPIPAPQESMDIYVWRASTDEPVKVTESTSPGDLGSRGNKASFSFSLASDLFEISKPRPAVVITGRGSMTLETSIVLKVGPFAGPLNGHQTRSFITVSEKDAKLLRKGSPIFSCALGRESPDASLERFLLNWNKKMSAKNFERYCVPNAEDPKRMTSEELKALKEKDGIVILEYSEDDC